MSKVEMLEAEVNHLKAQLDMLERLLTQAISHGHSHDVAKEDSKTITMAHTALRQMTQKQHAALQMVLRGASNKEIADRFQVTESTAKVYLRGIMKHLGVSNRAKVLMMVLPVIRDMTDREYLNISGGVPKDWDINHEQYKELNEVLYRSK